jgi:hypothetical protein
VLSAVGPAFKVGTAFKEEKVEAARTGHGGTSGS